MKDERIVELYWQRDERAIAETDAAYGNYLKSISFGILSDREDAEECVNDTYLDAWNAMPPHRPAVLSAFLGKITRRISIDRWRKKNTAKRGGGEVALALDELEECLPGGDDPAGEEERRELSELIRRFLNGLPVTERRVFLCRYWYLDSVPTIARQFGFTQSKTASMLHRTRARLRALLEKEGY